MISPLDCISLGFLNHCKDLYIYIPVRSIRLLVLVIYQLLYGCPKRPNQDLFCLFCRFSLAVFWLIIGQGLENPHSGSSDSIYPKRNRWLFSIILGFWAFLNRNIFPSQLLFYPSKEARGGQIDQKRFLLRYQTNRPLLERAQLVSLLYNFRLFYSAFTISVPKHKSTIFGCFITRRFYTFCLFLLFNTIRFHHLYTLCYIKMG